MSEYVLADGAEDDIEKIADYTIKRWGVDQWTVHEPGTGAASE